MALTNAFYDAVKTGNVRRVRIMMKDSLLIDPSFSDFEKMEKVAYSLNKLYDIHDGGEFITNPSLWNDEYMNQLMVQVVTNFSHERVEHLKSVVQFLRPVKKKETVEQPKTKPSDEKRMKTTTTSKKKDMDGKNSGKDYQESYQEMKRRDKENGDYLGSKIAAGALIGAFLGGVIASAASASVMSGVAVGAVIGGVTVTVVGKGETE